MRACLYIYIYIYRERERERDILCCYYSRILHVSQLDTKTGTVTNTKSALVFLRKACLLLVINSVCSVCYEGITFCTNVLFFCLALFAVLEAAFSFTAWCLASCPMQLIAAGCTRLGKPAEGNFGEVSAFGV